MAPQGEVQGGLRAPTGKTTIKPQGLKNLFLADASRGKGLNDSSKSRSVKPKILSNQKEQMAYLFDLTSITLTGPSRNCYNDLVLLHDNLS
jgi:hypothetical protein